MEFNRPNRPTGDISLTPIIDMVFLLLIFFLLTSSFMKDQGITVNLPSSASPLAQKPESVTVSIDQDKIIYINSSRTTLPRLEKDLQGAYHTTGAKNVIIKADTANSIQLLIRVMDVVNASGAESLTLATKMELSPAQDQ